jgi:hypothetical protein
MNMFLPVFSQGGTAGRDSIPLQEAQQNRTDSIVSKKPKSGNTIESTVTYTANGYIRRNIIDKKVVLVDQAKVNYGEIEITADSILINMDANTLFAIGRQDTTGKIIGKPVFKQGTEEIKADNLIYNFKTKRAIATNIETKQDQGLLRSSVTKLLEDGTSNISGSTYSTCEAEMPHFYINLPKAKIYPGKKLVSGPGNLVLEGVPLPLFLPFGYFPIQTRKAASGILIPRIGQENERGYSLTDWGYYFAINDYFDMTVRGNVYSNGSWMGTTQSSYKKLYKYSGNFSFSYANNVTGHKGLEDYRENANYRIGWTFNQDPKSSPGSRFGASVNMSSSGFDRNNSYNVTEHVTTQRQSSISYSKTWEGSPFNFSASMNHSQDVSRKTVSLNLPQAAFNMNRIYPLKSKNNTGQTKWYQELQFSYSAKLDNQINTYDSLLFTPQVWKSMRNGFRHDAPLSLQIQPFKNLSSPLLRPLKNFSISPSVTYSGVLFDKRVEQYWETIDPVTGEVRPSIKKDTIPGLSYGHAINTAINASISPQIFGTYQFSNPNSRIQSIRHVIKPSISFSYIPTIKGLNSNMYRQVQIDTLGHTQEYSIYNGFIYPAPTISRKSGNIAFSLINIVEAKVFEKNDTTGKPKKIKLIDNFSINTAYNIFADSMRWQPVSMQLRTVLANNINISASSVFSPYGLNSKGQQIDVFAFRQNGKLLRLTSVGASVDLNVSDLLRGKKTAAKTASTPNALTGGVQQTGPTDANDLSQRNTGAGLVDEYGYSVFDVPWSMNLSYNFSYSKPAFKSSIQQAMILTGNVSVTKKMSMTYSTGYDFLAKKITMTQIGISRDLHCWEMNFNWVPNGYMKMWNFTIRVKASVLQDLKYERRKDFHDNY